MKRTYLSPDAQIVAANLEDIIRTSNGDINNMGSGDDEVGVGGIQ